MEHAGPQANSNNRVSFKLSGLLAAEQNQHKGTGKILKYTEPLDAAHPDESPAFQWHVYIFKDEKVVAKHELTHKSAFLIGRDTDVCDMAAEHPSVSKQHAVVQFRRRFEVQKLNDDDAKQHFAEDVTNLRQKRILPYVIDLESANGTLLNGKRLEPRRFYELLPNDVLMLGSSSREYVFVCDSENSRNLRNESDKK